jgi:hypothetical protein
MVVFCNAADFVVAFTTKPDVADTGNLKAWYGWLQKTQNKYFVSEYWG